MARAGEMTVQVKVVDPRDPRGHTHTHTRYKNLFFKPKQKVIKKKKKEEEVVMGQLDLRDNFEKGD